MAPALSPSLASGSIVGCGAVAAVGVYSAAHATVTPVSFVLAPGDHSIVTFTVNCTALTAAASVGVKVEAYDPASDAWVTLLDGTAVTATGRTEYSVGPHAPVTSGLSAQCALAEYLRFKLTGADTKSVTYSVGVRAS